ncbi:MAG TPA: hypothetical protein DIT05_17965 [Morganella sp. (in: Bacteria)]|nr:hypothetical protein [Morganella sp. (in: enterobacteria)]
MLHKKFSIKKEDIISIALLIILLLSCILYYNYFVAGKSFTYEPVNGFIYPVNIHDNYIYLQYIARINDNLGELIGINNNIGISTFYFLIAYFFNVIGINIDFNILSLCINNILICFIFLSYRKIIILLYLPRVYILTFFLCISLIYFSQLINKDIFTILFFLKCIEYSIQKKYKMIISLSILSFFIRFQLLPLFILYLIIIKRTKHPIIKILFIYTILSILNGILSRYQLHFFNEKTLGSGLSYLIFSINQQYFIGSLLFNPIRIIQYIHDLILSFDFIIDNKIDVGRLKNIPQAIVFIFLLPFIITPFLRYRKSIENTDKYFISLTISFFMIWLFNPTINVRYFICLLPTLQIFGFYQLNKYRLKIK